jgi:hypothetical protein
VNVTAAGFRLIVTARFGNVTAGFGIVTIHFGDRDRLIGPS